MANNLERLGGASLSGSASPMPAQGNVMRNLPAVQKDPVGVLRAVGLNVPANLTPKGIVDYLTQSGQISDGELNQVIGMARLMGANI